MGRGRAKQVVQGGRAIFAVLRYRFLPKAPTWQNGVFCEGHPQGQGPKKQIAGGAGGSPINFGPVSCERAASPAYPVEAYPAGRPQCEGCTAK